MKVIITIALVHVLVSVVCTTSVKTVGTVHSLAKRNEGSGEHGVLRPACTGISERKIESAGLIAADGTVESAQATTLCPVLIPAGAPKNCSSAAFDNGRVRIFVTGVLVRTRRCHLAIATWGRGNTTSRPPTCVRLAIGPIVVDNLSTDVSAYISS
jgi:hypothetical protein